MEDEMVTNDIVMMERLISGYIKQTFTIDHQVQVTVDMRSKQDRCIFKVYTDLDGTQYTTSLSIQLDTYQPGDVNLVHAMSNTLIKSIKPLTLLREIRADKLKAILYRNNEDPNVRQAAKARLKKK